MSTDVTARIGYGIDLEDNIPDWLAELFEDESQIPGELELVCYGSGDAYTGVFIALKRTYQWAWDTQPKELSLEVMSQIRDNQSILRQEMMEALEKISGSKFNKETSHPKWMLLANYC